MDTLYPAILLFAGVSVFTLRALRTAPEGYQNQQGFFVSPEAAFSAETPLFWGVIY